MLTFIECAVSDLGPFPWTNVLSLVNTILTSGIVILSFAFLLYILLYNLRSNVARAFCTLLACVLIVYLADLAVAGASLESSLKWLRLQWLGIAFTPAGYLHLSDALLQTTNDRSRARTMFVRLAYGLGGLTLLAAAFSDWVVWDGLVEAGAAHLRAGVLFWVFLLYFIGAVGWGAANVARAWLRCLTPTSRRRMTYLVLALIAPAIGVFPYLLITGWPEHIPGAALWGLLVLGNLVVGLMLLVMAYAVALLGTLTPDRVVKHRFVRFLLRGPVQTIAVVVVITAASRANDFLGLSPLRLTLFGVVVTILLIQLGVEVAKPVIDRLLYRRDQNEIAWLQGLGNRLLTTTDLHQFLENVLTALCDLLRTSAAFVAVTDGGSARMEVVCGPLGSFADALPPAALDAIAGEPHPDLRRYGRFFIWDGYWLLPLYNRAGETLIGVLGTAGMTAQPNLFPAEEAALEALVRQIEAALEDRLIQQNLFSALEQMIPQIEDIQRRRGLLRYEGLSALTGLADPVTDPEFPRLVWEALAHYWGGPKLTQSPLLNLRVVERASEEVGNRVNALREVLQRAIERLKPEGDRSMTATEWLLYNILELKFLRGYRVRDVALRLAMSESDLYRKQRVAVEEVARALVEMEQQETRGDGDAVTR